MGKVMQQVKLTNISQVIGAESGWFPKDQVKSVELEMLVDTGASLICLPKSFIKKLELTTRGTRDVVTANGKVTRAVYSPVNIQIMERDANIDVMELPEDTPPLLGYIALEALDLIVNPRMQRLEGNPAHDGKFVIDML